jgi:ABC-type Fe3+/spermidine/putrescine transport system ATPase subunit
MRPAVELNHVCFSYGKSTLALGKRKLYIEKLSKNIMKKRKLNADDINLRVEKGTIFALLGPSGCGKTTLLKVR